MDFKYVLFGLLGVGGLATIPFLNTNKQGNQTVEKLSQISIQDIHVQGEQKLSALKQQYDVTSCWKNAQSIIQDGRWYSATLAENIQSFKETCLGNSNTKQPGAVSEVQAEGEN